MTDDKVQRQIHRLKMIAARADAENLIAEKFGQPMDDSVFLGGIPPELRDEAERQRREWLQLDRAMGAERPSPWERMRRWLRGTTRLS